MANKTQQFKYKGSRCAGCGMPVEEIVARYGTFNRLMQFHHIDPNEKTKNYKNLVRRTISTEQLDELDKCALLCGGCHDIVHAQNMRGTLVLTVSIEGHDVSQKLDGWYKLDNVDRKLVFISNQKLLLEPYRVTVGNHPKKVLCGIEIERKSLMKGWLVDLDLHKKLKITSMEGRTLMSAEYVKGRLAKLSQEIGFPLLTIDLSVKEGKSPCLWVRNGMMLHKDGSIKTKGILSYNLKLREKNA